MSLLLPPPLGDWEIEAQEGLWRLPWLTLQSSSFFGCSMFRISQCGWLQQEFCFFFGSGLGLVQVSY